MKQNGVRERDRQTEREERERERERESDVVGSHDEERMQKTSMGARRCKLRVDEVVSETRKRRKRTHVESLSLLRTVTEEICACSWG